MKIISIKAQNFWSYLSLEFTFDRGLCLIEGHNTDEQGSNGSGKSALLNSVCFALFGDLPKSIKLDDVINKKAPHDCTVELLIEDNNHIYKIIRGRSPNILKFFVNDIATHDVDVRKTQKLIENTLGLTYSTFINSIYFAQQSTNFLVANDEQKKQILTDLLNLKIFDKAEDLAHRKLKDVEASFMILKSQNAADKSIIDSLNAQNIDLKTQSKYYNEEQKQKIQNLNLEINNIRTNIATLTQKQNESTSLIQSIETRLNTFLTSEKPKKIEALDIFEDEYRRIETDITELKTKLRYESSNLSSLEVTTPICPTCRQNVDFELLKNQRSDIEKNIIVINEALNIDHDDLRTLPNRAELTAQRSQLNSHEQELRTSLQACQYDIKATATTINNVQSRIPVLENAIITLQAETNPYQSMMQKNEVQLIEKNQKFLLDQQTISDQTIAITNLTFLQAVFSNKGIKSYVFDTVVNELNTRVNNYLTKLFDQNVRLRFLSESTTAKGDVKQTFTTQFLKDNIEVALGNFSGGEERRLIFAINLALADIIASRSNKSFNIAFFDEVFDGLDTEGKVKCMTLLQELSTKRDCILVIDHASDFVTAFDNVIRIEKQDGISVIK